ncbi:MAG: DUF3084 domain-containing protein [Xenococcaceae cyanobacterium MO_188.B19]|nr:DUF3084 domain-containing protein [Xenococcaceae cyanobacterium MO_188.B19]
MTSAYILIAAILVLGGLIAVLGDRLGTKVGKARLRLFNLRPRQTATIVTIITGTLISASTYGILFALSESLRDGVFNLDEILSDLRNVKSELDQANQQKQEVENQLATVKQQQIQATQRLKAIEQDLQESKSRLAETSQQASQLRSELNIILAERTKQLEQLENLNAKSQQLQVQLEQREQKILDQNQVIQESENRLQELKQQQSILQSQISERDAVILNLDRAISAKDQDLKARQSQLQDLEAQLQFLQREVKILEQYYQTYQELRERKIAIFKGEVLASATVRIIDPKAAIPAIDRLLAQANLNAIQAVLQQETLPDPPQRLVRITTAQVKHLAEQIQDGRDYVVRILSAGNYVQGEEEVRIFADLTVNKQIFAAGEEIATVSIDSQQMNNEDIQDRVNWLLAASKFRAQRAGIVGDLQIADGQIMTIFNFIDQVVNSAEPLDEIKVVVSETTYTAGPLKLNLVVVKDGKIVFST